MSTHDPELHKPSPHEPLEMTLARLLRIGSFIAAVLIAVGIVSGRLTGSETFASQLITMGLLALLATPIMRVATAAVIFVREKDWRFACFCLVVICALVAGMFLGHAHA